MFLMLQYQISNYLQLSGSTARSSVIMIAVGVLAALLVKKQLKV